MKIVLAALNAKYVHSNLGVHDIAAYTKKQWQDAGNLEQIHLLIREYTINHNLDQILQSLYEEKADVVAFSCYIWNIQEILMIARELNKVSPQTGIWLGGPEVSYHGSALLEQHPFINGIMKGEGEKIFYHLTKVWSGQYPLQDVKGILYRDEEGTILETVNEELMNLDEIPFIYQDLSKFENKILYYETSRGCPFSCSYCLSSIDKRVRFRSLFLVEKELQFFLDQKVEQVKFIDRTFNCKKSHALAIWRYLLEHDNGITNFHFEVSADLIDEEELSVIKQMRPGLIQLEIGLQSTNQQTIKEIRRVMDITALKKNMLTIRSFHNTHQHLDLIAGLPYEDFDRFQQSFNDAYAMKPNQLQLGFLKVLKGSYMGEQVDAYELKYQDSQPYEVLSTKWLSYDRVLQLKQVEEMVEVYYNSDQFEHVLSYLISLCDTPYRFYEALGRYYKEHELFGIGVRRELRYVVLRDFAIEYFAGGKSGFDPDILESLLTFDYYLRENAKNRPVWRKELPIDKTVYRDFFIHGGSEQYQFKGEAYDSKVAARVMHIEPVSGLALPWILEENEYTCCFKPDEKDKPSQYYCLYDYDKRNALTKDGSVVILSKL